MAELSPQEEEELKLLEAADIKEKTQAQTAIPGAIPVPEQRTVGNVLQTAGRNLPLSGLETGKNIFKAITSPVQTAKNIGGFVLGGIETGANKLTETITGAPVTGQPVSTNQEMFNQVLQTEIMRLKDPIKTFAEDPIGIITDLSSIILSGGAVLKSLGKVTKASKVVSIGSKAIKVGKAIDPFTPVIDMARFISKPVRAFSKSVLSIATSEPAENISRAFRGGPEFRAALKGQVKDKGLLNAARDALFSLKEKRAVAYENRLKTFANIKTSLNLQPVAIKLDALKKQFGISGSGNGLDFSRAVIDSSEVPRLKKLIQTIETWGTQAGDLTPKGVDILKRRLDDFFTTGATPGVDASAASKFVQELKAPIVKVLEDNVLGYKKMTSEYAKVSADIREFNKTLSLSGTPDQAISKLTSFLQSSSPYREELIARLDEIGGTNMRSTIAGLNMQTIAPGGKSGRILGALELMTGIATMNPAFIGVLAASSPKIVGEFLFHLGNISRSTSSPITRQFLRKGGQLPNVEEGANTQGIARLLQGGTGSGGFNPKKGFHIGGAKTPFGGKVSLK